MRDPGVVDALDVLEKYAKTFDAISREQDAHYSARAFVRWVRLETSVPTGHARHGAVADAGGRTAEAA